jgi:hypothetical protein
MAPLKNQKHARQMTNEEIKTAARNIAFICEKLEKSKISKSNALIEIAAELIHYRHVNGIGLAAALVFASDEKGKRLLTQ